MMGAGIALAVEPTEVLHVTEGLQYHHFAAGPIDEGRAEKALFIYLTEMDPGHCFLTQEEVASLTKGYAGRIAEELKSGEMKSSREFFAKAAGLLSAKIPVIEGVSAGIPKGTRTEKLYPRDWRSAWPKDEAELKLIWGKRLPGEFQLEEERQHPKGRTASDIVLGRIKKRAELCGAQSTDEQDEHFLTALCRSYDPHSDYLGVEALEDFKISMGLKFCGIGAVLTPSERGAEITSLSKGGPAAKSGAVRKGDRIIGVKTEKGEVIDLTDWPLNKIVKTIRGKAGTKVNLELERGGKIERATLVREEIQLNDQAAKGAVIDTGNGGGKIALVSAPAFYHDEEGRSLSKDVEAILRGVQKMGAEAVVLDLRENGGGALDEAIELFGLFKKNAVAVQIKNSDGTIVKKKTKEKGETFGLPTVVLVDRMSASASEIFSGAMQDYGRGLIVGDSTTFGKGTVQAMVDLNRIAKPSFFLGTLLAGAGEGDLKMTVQKFYRPSGVSTQEQGVKSDIVIPSASDVPDVGERALPWPLPFDSVKEAEARTPIAPEDVSRFSSNSMERVKKEAAFSEELAKRERRLKSMAEGELPIGDAKMQKESEKKVTGLLDKEAVVAVTLRGGDVEWSKGKVGDVYQGERVVRERDIVLEEAVNIALDYSLNSSKWRGEAAMSSP